MADDEPVPMDLGSVGAHDARMTQSDQDASNDMSYGDVRDSVERIQSWQRFRQERNGRGIEEKEPGKWASGERDDGGKKGGKEGSKGRPTA